MRQLINREIGKATENEQKLELRVGNRIISNPTAIRDKLNTHFISTVTELIKQKNNESVYDLEIKHCPNSIFMYPVTEEEVISLTKKGNLPQVLMTYLRI